MRTFPSGFQTPLRSLLGTQILLCSLIGGCVGQPTDESTNGGLDHYQDTVSVEFRVSDRHIAADVRPVPSEFNTDLGSVSFEDASLLFVGSINTEASEGWDYPELEFRLEVTEPPIPGQRIEFKARPFSLTYPHRTTEPRALFMTARGMVDAFEHTSDPNTYIAVAGSVEFTSTEPYQIEVWKLRMVNMPSGAAVLDYLEALEDATAPSEVTPPTGNSWFTLDGIGEWKPRKDFSTAH